MLHEEALHPHRVGLADPVDAIDRLLLHCRVPPRVHQVDRLRRHQVGRHRPHAATAASLSRRRRQRSGSAWPRAAASTPAVQPHVRQTLAVEGALREVEHRRPLGDDHRFAHRRRCPTPQHGAGVDGRQRRGERLPRSASGAVSFELGRHAVSRSTAKRELYCGIAISSERRTGIRHTGHGAAPRGRGSPRCTRGRTGARMR